MKQYNLVLGGIGFRILSDCALFADESIVPFLASHLDRWDINIEISRNFTAAPMPVSSMAGDDLLLDYYFEQDQTICLVKGGQKGPIAVTVCDPTYTHLVCYLNPLYPNSCNTLNQFLRMIPIRTVLQRRNVLFFHASQIEVQGKGILFTAPSGTGKTTQAKLWNLFRNAKLVCNDRTLVYGGRTYGYPMDGSEPIRSAEIHELGAIVLLSQSLQNHIHRLKPSQALLKLLPQLVMDGWDGVARELATLQIIRLIQIFPVYHLACTPDENAVICLEKQLKEDGVLK